jgi:hypothetical protein
LNAELPVEVSRDQLTGDGAGVTVDGSGEAVEVAEISEGEEVFEHRLGKVLLTHELVDRVGDGVSYRPAIGGFVEVTPETMEGTVIVSDDCEEAKLVGLRHGEAVEEDAFGEGEDDGVGSDAEGERGDSDGGEAGAATQHADCVAKVGAEFVEETEAEGGPDVHPVSFHVAKFDTGAAESLGGRETGTLQVFGAQLDVGAEFGVDIGLDRVAAEKGVEVGAKLGSHG